MEHVLPDGLKIYYEIQGKKESEVTLVFLNGLSQSTASWLGIAPAFYRECKVILCDLIFQGQSSEADQFRTYDDHAADIHHLLKANATGKIILCGISYGSAVAQHLIVNYPDAYSGAILLSTFAHETEQFNYLGGKWKDALIDGGYAKMLDVMLPDVLGKSYFEKPIIPIETLKESRVSRDLKTGSLLKLMEATEKRGDYRMRLKEVKIPVLVVQGEEDVLIPPDVAKHVADNIPGAEFLVLEKVGHTLNLEAIPQVVSLIRNFISKMPEG